MWVTPKTKVLKTYPHQITYTHTMSLLCQWIAAVQMVQLKGKKAGSMCTEYEKIMLLKS